MSWTEYVTDAVTGRTVARSDSGVEPGLEDEYASSGTRLTILSANRSDAGTYDCRNIVAPQQIYKPELIVLGTHNIVICDRDVWGLLNSCKCYIVQLQ